MEHTYLLQETGQGNWQCHLIFYIYKLQNWIEKGEIKFKAQGTGEWLIQKEGNSRNRVCPTEILTLNKVTVKISQGLLEDELYGGGRRQFNPNPLKHRLLECEFYKNTTLHINTKLYFHKHQLPQVQINSPMAQDLIFPLIYFTGNTYFLKIVWERQKREVEITQDMVSKGWRVFWVFHLWSRKLRELELDKFNKGVFQPPPSTKKGK